MTITIIFVYLHVCDKIDMISKLLWLLQIEIELSFI